MEFEKVSQTNEIGHHKVNILGVGISAIDLEFALDQIDTWIGNDDRKYISVCNVYTIIECHKSSAMREAVNNADMATPDGMPLVWLSKCESDRSVGRVYGPDLMLALCQRSAKSGYKHCFYGGAEEVPKLLAEVLKGRYPGLQVAGEFSPPYRSLTLAEEDRTVEMLNEADPDIIWVGLGTPKQDLWMAKYRPRLNAPVVIAVGAAFDFLTNRVPQAPDWMQRNGLEWLYRLVQEPKRLWYRYLVCNPLFILKVFGQKTGIRKYQL